MEEYCVCGHEVERHAKRICYECLYPLHVRGKLHSIHRFKLDNLRFIEDLAKERNLIN